MYIHKGVEIATRGGEREGLRKGASLMPVLDETQFSNKVFMPLFPSVLHFITRTRRATSRFLIHQRYWKNRGICIPICADTVYMGRHRLSKEHIKINEKAK